MRLNLACTDFSFPLLRFEAVLDLLVALEIPALDLGLFEGLKHLSPSVELVRPEKSGARLRAMLLDRGLQIADIFMIGANREDLAPNNPDPDDNRKSRDLFERGLDYVRAAGGTHFTQLPGVIFDGHRVEQCFQRSVTELTWRAMRAAQLGVVYAVEPHRGSVIETPATALRMAKSAAGLTFSLDYSHFTSVGHPESEIEPLLRYSSHFHVRGARHGRLQASFQENTIDYRRVLAAMNEVQYSGYLGLEYVWIEWDGCNQCDNLSETILFRDYLTKTAKEL